MRRRELLLVGLALPGATLAGLALPGCKPKQDMPGEVADGVALRELSEAEARGLGEWIASKLSGGDPNALPDVVRETPAVA